jgi:hypothetical protein
MKFTEGRYALGALTLLALWLFIGLPVLNKPDILKEYKTYPSDYAKSAAGSPNGSLESPLFVQVLPGADAAEKANRENEDRLNKKDADRWLVRWTMALFLATGLLFIVTGGLCVFAYQQIRLMNEEFNATHRPKIRLKHLWLTTDIWEGEMVQATAVFVNTGMAPAILLELNFGTYIIKSGRMLPTDPNWIKKCTAPLATHAPLGAGISLEIKGLNDGRVLKDADNVALRKNERLLYFAGAIEYRDRQGAIRKTAFCRVLKLDENANAGQRGRFLPVEDKDYEYRD